VAMRRGAILFAGFMFAFAFDARAIAAPHARLANRVDRVSAAVEGGKLVIEVNGAVSSGGWTHPRLRLKPSAPEAHIIALTLQADPPPPHRVVLQALLPVDAEIKLTVPKNGIVGVSVTSQTNEITTQIRR
jgi:hypothetical protein